VFRETERKGCTSIDVWELDLANYQSVLAFGDRVRTQLPRLDAFIANAGLELHEFQTAEGLEMHLTVNVVSTLLSGIVVLPKLKQTSKEHGLQTTLTFCGSSYHIFGPDAEFDAGFPDDVDMFDVLSDQSKTDIVWRYSLSKLMVHQCARELAACVSQSADTKTSDVVVNFVNPGWCGTEISRARPHPAAEKVAFALMGWTAEKGSRVYVHAMAAGKESHGKYISECQIKPDSQYMRSERGLRIQKKIWSDLMLRIGGISPKVAGYVR
jgi:retinol dehydrogenase-12